MRGAYDNQITLYQVINCNLDYEYNHDGGHIHGNANMNTTTEIEEFLLGDNTLKPTATSGRDNVKKTILICHCDFSWRHALKLYV